MTEVNEMMRSFNIEGAASYAVILDASESAYNYKSNILELAQKVVSALPLNLGGRIYFLGNPKAYSPNNFSSKGSDWFDDNRGRGSVIAPIFDALSCESQVRVVIIGSGRIFDLEDWIGLPILRNTRLISLEEPLGDQRFAAQESSELSHPDICRFLNDPAREVRISGPGFMPVWWDNRGYRFELSSGEASLTGVNLTDFTINMRLVSVAAGEIQALITRASGSKTAISLESIEATEPIKRKTGILTDKGVEIFRKAVQREQFKCAHCNKIHSWDNLLCFEKVPVIGSPVYPSFQKTNTRGFILLREEQSKVYYEIHESDIMRLSSQSIAVKDRGKAIIYRFNSDTSQWVETDEVMVPYQKVMGGHYAIFI